MFSGTAVVDFHHFPSLGPFQKPPIMVLQSMPPSSPYIVCSTVLTSLPEVLSFELTVGGTPLHLK